MLVQVNAGTVQNSEAIEKHTRKVVDAALRYVGSRVTRVEVHLNDDNAGKSGPQDKHCTIEARIASQQPFAVDAKADNLYTAITAAAHKLSRAVNHRLQKLAVY